MSGSSAVGDSRRVAILGCRGVPAAHGGFETFAERLALYLASAGWQVKVACQADPVGADVWHGCSGSDLAGACPVRWAPCCSTLDRL